MKKPAPITSSDMQSWVKELAQLSDDAVETNGFLTVKEIMEKTGLSSDKVRTNLRTAHKKGILIPERQLRMSIDGVARYAPCYKIKIQPKGKR